MTSLGAPAITPTTSPAYRLLAILTCIMVSLGAWSGCSEDPAGPAQVRVDFRKGITLADWTVDGYDGCETPEAVMEMADISASGATWISFIVTGYQSNLRSTTIRSDPLKTPAVASIADAVSRWQGMHPFDPEVTVLLKVHIDVDTGEWRGKIKPSDPVAWFESYKAFLMPYVVQAEFQNVKQLSVGTELAGLVEHEDLWRGLIGEVRKVFSGELVYAASWDEAPMVPFWDALDFVGVNFYAPVATRDPSSRFDLLAGWQPWLDRIRLLHKQTDKNIILTEIGYRSIDGAAQHPYDFERDAAVDMEEQADLYWAAMQAVGDKPWIEGMHWWNWLIDSTPGAEEKDFTPEGKPAQKELIDAWK